MKAGSSKSELARFSQILQLCLSVIVQHIWNRTDRWHQTTQCVLMTLNRNWSISHWHHPSCCRLAGGGWRRRGRRRWRRRRRGGGQGEQVRGQQQRIKFAGLVGLWFGLRLGPTPWDGLSSAALSQESRELCHCANPALLPPPGGATALPHPLHTHPFCVLFPSRWSSHGGTLASCPTDRFHSLPGRRSSDVPLVWWCHQRPLPASTQWFNGFCPSFNVEGIWRSNFILLLTSWRHVASESQRT